MNTTLDRDVCSCITWARTDGRLTSHHPRCPAFAERRFVKIKVEGGGCYTQPEDQLGVLLDEIKEAFVGAKWTLELVTLTQEEFDRLPEFAGH